MPPNPSPLPVAISTTCSCVKYVPEPEDSVLLHTALDIYRHFQQYPHALRLAMMLNDVTLVKKLFLGCPDRYKAVIVMIQLL